jgi:transcription initiation factor TFIIE subunit alpha
MTTGLLRCTYCQAEVIEEAATQAGNDTRSTMAKFNEQIEPIYALLRKVEDIRLSADILEPEPLEFKPSK